MQVAFKEDPRDLIAFKHVRDASPCFHANLRAFLDLFGPFLDSMQMLQGQTAAFAVISPNPATALSRRRYLDFCKAYGMQREVLFLFSENQPELHHFMNDTLTYRRKRYFPARAMSDVFEQLLNFWPTLDCLCQILARQQQEVCHVRLRKWPLSLRICHCHLPKC